MKLCELKPGDKFYIKSDNVRIPPASYPVERDALLTFHNLDGMYSFCTDEFGTVVHPAVWTEVERVDLD